MEKDRYRTNGVHNGYRYRSGRTSERSEVLEGILIDVGDLPDRLQREDRKPVLTPTNIYQWAHLLRMGKGVHEKAKSVRESYRAIVLSVGEQRARVFFYPCMDSRAGLVPLAEFPEGQVPLPSDIYSCGRADANLLTRVELKRDGYRTLAKQLERVVDALYVKAGEVPKLYGSVPANPSDSFIRSPETWIGDPPSGRSEIDAWWLKCKEEAIAENESDSDGNLS